MWCTNSSAVGLGEKQQEGCREEWVQALSAGSCQPFSGVAFLLLLAVFWEESICSLPTSSLLSGCQGTPKKSSASSDADCFEEPSESFFKALHKVGQLPREEHGGEQWLDFYGQKERTGAWKDLWALQEEGLRCNRKLVGRQEKKS